MTPEDIDATDAMELMLGKTSKFVFSTVGWLKGRWDYLSEDGHIYIITRLEAAIEQHEQDSLKASMFELFSPETAQIVTCLGSAKHAEAWKSLFEFSAQKSPHLHYQGPPQT